jgi:hypothetical protein
MQRLYKPKSSGHHRESIFYANGIVGWARGVARPNHLAQRAKLQRAAARVPLIDISPPRPA